MKKIGLYIVILQLLSGHMFLSEVAKVSSLLQHYVEHKQENTAIDFLTFINMHYNDPQHQQSDARHKSLPLKTVSNAHIDLVSMPQAYPSVCAVLAPVFIVKSALNAASNPFFDSKIRLSVFQPPRCA